MTRVVITGRGSVSGFGVGRQALLSGVYGDQSAVRLLSDPVLAARPYGIGAEATSFDPLSVMPAHEVRHQDRFILLGLAAAREALAEAGLVGQQLTDWGVFAGTAVGGITTLVNDSIAFSQGKRMSPFLLPKFIPNMAATTLAMELGARGMNLTFVTACAASTNAIGEAFRAIRDGIVEAAVALGTESLFVGPLMDSLGTAKALSTRHQDPGTASRPFSLGRDGMVMGEGAGALVLESHAHAMARGATPLAEVLGYGAGSDAYHPTAPRPDGQGAYEVMAAALRDANMDPKDISYVKAHGTSTPAGDQAEARAIRRLFGAGAPPVGSLKGALGHLLGASGAVEAVVCVEALLRHVIPPSVNLIDQDPAIDIPIVRVPTPTRIRAIMANAFGFGGQNAALVLAPV
ncbi:MAG: beta-ketoacyl-[acyl-carrier-protein] synthase family protein [Sulfobacillus sp.]